MIEANQLRINNLLKNQFDATVIKVSANDILYLSEGGDPFVFEPITLTEEWLINFGFNYAQGEEVYECIWSLKGFEFWQHDEGFCHDFFNGGDIDYVHELQNLYFALTKTELQLKQ